MSTDPTTTEPRPLRSDAARNRERVIEAALEVFGEHGLDAPITEVATRAGLGKATIYRSYPTRQHLVGAIVIDKLAWYREEAVAALQAPDAWEAFSELMLATCRQQADRTFSSCLAASIDLPEVAEARAEAGVAIDQLMARAQAQGRMRPGITNGDLRVLFSGAGRMLNDAGIDDPRQWRRYVGLMLDAFRADGEPPLPLTGDALPLPKTTPAS